MSEGWQGYYERTKKLPDARYTKKFLEKLPKNASVLDFGAGSCAWSFAFMRDRPDITIDLLDKNIGKIEIPENWRGEIIYLDFRDFHSLKLYDGIWAHSSLFFINNSELEKCFHELVKSLKTGGIFHFTMVDDAISDMPHFYGMSEDSILQMVEREGLTIHHIEDSVPLYGAQKIPIRTYDIEAEKKWGCP